MKLTPVITPQKLSVSVSAPSVGADTGTPVVKEYVDVENYMGDYVFTPGDEDQIVPIGGYRATQDITVKAIPSNYGKITYNGAILTVS